jgi:hypothetical protein
LLFRSGLEWAYDVNHGIVTFELKSGNRVNAWNHNDDAGRHYDNV